MENGPFHHKLELLSISTERIFCVHTQNISFPKTELISASHLDITGHLKIQCYLWFLFSLLLSWFVASGDLVVLSLENRYGKSIIHMNLQSIMVIKALPHTYANPFSLWTLQDLFSEDSRSNLHLFHGLDRLSNTALNKQTNWPCCSYSCQVWTFFWYSQVVLRSLFRESAHLCGTCFSGVILRPKHKLWNRGMSSLSDWMTTVEAFHSVIQS